MRYLGLGLLLVVCGAMIACLVVARQNSDFHSVLPDGFSHTQAECNQDVCYTFHSY